MADFDLGTARGRIDLDARGAVKGSAEADAAFRSIDDGANSAAKSSTAVGTALVGFGAVAVLAFGAAVKASADFEKKLSDFSSLGDDYKNNIDQIREKALQLGADTSFSAGEAADAMVELGKQGLSTKEILEGAADATVALAAAGGIDLAEAAGVAAAALNQFKLEAKDLPEVADLLAGAANASATGVSEIGQALKFVGPVANAVGLSIKDTAAAIALLANNGLDASQAGTALRAILSRLQPQSKEAAAVMRELGLVTKDGKNQFFDATGNIKDFRSIVEVLSGSLKGLTAQQQAQALKTIFGTEALAAANVIAAETGETFGELQKQIGAVKAADVAAEKMNNLAGAIEEFKGSVETAMIRAGAPFQKGLTGIVRAATGLINMFSNLNPEIQKWIGYVVAATGALALLVGGVILLTDAITKSRAAFAALNLVISNNPIVRFILILAAVAAAVIAAYKNIEGFRNAVDRLWESLQPLIDNIRSKLGTALDWLANTVLPTITSKFEELKAKAGEVASWLGDRLSGPVTTAWQFIQDKISQVADFIQTSVAPRLSAGLETIRSKGTEVKDWFTGTFAPGVTDFWFNTVVPKWNEFTAWIGGTFVPTITNALAPIEQSIREKVVNAFASIGTAVEGGGIQEKLAGVGNAIRNGIGTAVQFLTDTVLPKIQQFIAFVQEQFGYFREWADVNLGPLFKAIGELITAVFNALGPAIEGTLERIKIVFTAFAAGAYIIWQLFGETILNVIRAVWGTIRGVIEGALKVITGIIQVVTALITGDWGKAWEGILNILKGVMQIAAAIVQGALELIVGIITGILAGIRNIWNLAFDAVANKVREVFDSIVNAVRGKLEEVRSHLETVSNFIKSIFNIDLYGIGKNIIQSFLNGLKSMFGPVQDAFNWLTDKIPDWKGPPQKDKKLLTENAHLIMAGFIGEIERGMRDVRNVLGTVAPMMATTTPTALALPAANTNSSVVINFEYSGGNPDEFVGAVQDSGLIGRLTSAARSRRP